MKHYAYESPFTMKDKEDNKYILTVEQDENAENPRDWDNVCTMVCFHRRYNLGDKHNYDDSDEFFDDILHDVCEMKYEDFQELSTEEKYRLAYESNKIYIKELNLYDHSGLTISTSSGHPYNDRWDASCVGWIYVSKEKTMAQWDEIPEENWREIAAYYVNKEVKVYDQYLRGDVYGYKLTEKVIYQEKCPHCGKVIREYENEEEVESYQGFYGDCIEENGIIDYLRTDLQFVEK